MAIYGPRGPGYAHKDYKPYHIQDLQYWLDKTSEAIMVLEANVDVISALQRFYFSLRENKDFPDNLKQNNADDITSFNAQLDEIISDFRMQISRTKLLVNIIRDRKELVSVEYEAFDTLTKIMVGSTASTRSSSGEDRAIESKLRERSNRDAYHHYCYLGVSSGNICIRK